MNRSIFQIWKKIESVNFKISYFLLFSLIIFLTVENNTVNCFSIKGVNTPFLKEVYYKNSYFKCSNNISDNKAITAMDCFLNSFQIQDVNLSLSKYYQCVNGASKPFYRQSVYSHPNLFLGVFNNFYFNLQFSHHKVTDYFKVFSDKDIINNEITQYLCYQFYIYSNELNQQYLNYNNLNQSKEIIYSLNTIDSIRSQNYLNFYDKDLKKAVVKVMNL